MGKKKKPGHAPHAQGKGASVFALSTYADFHCENCGLCCSTGWKIPIAKPLYERLSRYLRRGEIQHGGNPVADIDALLPPSSSGEAVAQCAWTEDGRCVFLEPESGNLCAIHRQMGADALSPVCRLFPRLCVLQPRGVFVSLSHYCPTVAALLFRPGPIEIVRNPAAFPPGDSYGGLDARTHLPPLLRPDVLLSWETYRLWERYAVSLMAREDYDPHEALIVLCTTVEKLRAWPEKQGPPLDFAESIISADTQADAAMLKQQIRTLPSGLHRCRAIMAELLNACSESALLGSVREAFLARYESIAADDYDRFVRQSLRDFQSPLRRYLAARLFANYFAYQGHGLRSGIYSVVCALAVFRMNAALCCGRENRPLDMGLFIEAIQNTDFLLFHNLSRAQTVQFLRPIEEASVMDLIGPIPD